MEQAIGATESSSQPLRPAAAGTDRGEFRALTSCRGFAALTVAIYHIFYEYYTDRGDVLTGPLAKGYLCVDFFFVLSGFVIAYAYRSYFLGGFRLSAYGKFLIRRIGRIYPLYFVVLTCVLAYTLILYGNFHSGKLPAVQSHEPVLVTIANYLLVFDWGIRVHGFVGASWSISTEMAAYVLFPVLLGVCFSTRAIVWTSALLVSIFALGAAYRLNYSLDLFSGMPSLIRCLSEFSLGIFAFRAYASGSAWSIRVGGNVALAAIFATAVMSLIVLRSDIAVALCMPALVLSLARNRGAAVRLLERGPFHWLGLVSYSVYLVHAELQHCVIDIDAALLRRSFSADTAFVVAASATVALILLVSDATYRLVEVPGRGFFKRLGARAKVPAGSSVAVDNSQPAS